MAKGIGMNTILVPFVITKSCTFYTFYTVKFQR